MDREDIFEDIFIGALALFVAFLLCGVFPARYWGERPWWFVLASAFFLPGALAAFFGSGYLVGRFLRKLGV